eukprot:GHUV01016820.1.p1 GENE.GHUV01016820.1~~GHUV01016820.1.p1  ORF type:complete len:378 (+),score=126.63 GHUV01016820.1:1498-2631(+)
MRGTHLTDACVCRWFFQQLILGVDYIHRKGFLHRCISLERIWLQMLPTLRRPLVKIWGFDHAHPAAAEAPTQYRGNPAYTAPELLVGLMAQEQVLPSEEEYLRASWDAVPNWKALQAADIWSCGVLLYTMLVGEHPFQVDRSKAREEMLQALLTAQLSAQDLTIPDSAKLSPYCVDLMMQLLQPDRTRRIAMEDILAHPWFQTDLPPNALTMNQGYVAVSHQSPLSFVEIKALTAQLPRLQQEALTTAQTAPASGIHMELGSRPPITARLQDTVTVQQQGTNFVPQQLLVLGVPGLTAVSARSSSSGQQVLLLQLHLQQCVQPAKQAQLLQVIQAAIKYRHPHVLQLQHARLSGWWLKCVTEPCSISLLQYIEQHGG